MASPTQWTWVWVNSRSWWWTGRPGVLQFMGSQRVEHDWATGLNWTELKEPLPQNQWKGFIYLTSIYCMLILSSLVLLIHQLFIWFTLRCAPKRFALDWSMWQVFTIAWTSQPASMLPGHFSSPKTSFPLLFLSFQPIHLVPNIFPMQMEYKLILLLA